MSYSTTLVRARPAQQRALGALPNVRADFDRVFLKTLDEFVSGTSDNTAAIVRRYKDSWSPAKLIQRGIDWASDYDSVGEWKKNLDNLALSIKETLTRRDASGLPFYQRKPDAAISLLENLKTDMVKEVKLFEEVAEGQTLMNLIAAMIDRLITMLWELAKKIVQYPKVLLAGVGLLLGYVAFKRLTR